MKRTMHWFLLLMLLWFWHDQTQQRFLQTEHAPFIQAEQAIYTQEERKLSEQFTETVRSFAQRLIYIVVGVGDWFSK